MKRLLKKLKGFDSSGADRLAVNIELEFATLKSSHPLAGIHGDNVQPAMEEKFGRRISSMNYDGLNDYDVQKLLVVHD